MNRHVLAPIGTALDCVAEERMEIDAERDALAEFAARVDACPVRSEPNVLLPADSLASVRTAGIDSDAPTRPTVRLQQAYRETVMEVDHYDAVYDEPLRVNVANEFGADVATALCEGVPFTPAFKRTLYDAATTARTERERLNNMLCRERRSLVDARADLDGIVTAMRRHDGPCDNPDGETAYPSLTELERRCKRVGDERQQVVRRQLRFSRLEDGVYDYLYRDQSWRYPVLSVVATLGGDLSAMHSASGVDN